jgi:hypothetical protein
MRRFAALGVAMALGGCSTVMAEAGGQQRCPPGQEHLRTAQLFFGRNVGARPAVSQADFQKFVDEEITTRFPDGLTVMDGGGQWRGSENQLIREASKVVLIVLPKRGDTSQRIEAVRAAYKTRFNQESVLLVTQAACVSF